ncbi:hypothetical protein [Spirosoma panaciterrae]|uniref:hypothetical protein n=1 Tax=Spirosoma panaciterrae TaxID=496058 RepID=UPI00036B5CCF|nr:hypothetical protein [Spirosoma panaciterrae]
MITNKLRGLFGVVLVLALGVFACETSDVDRIFEGPYFVRFTKDSLTYKESYSQPINIEVHNAGPQLDQAITINYTVGGTAREGKEYSFTSKKGTVTIPAKSSKANIVLKLINNANNILESSTVTFTITSVQPSSLQVGFGSGENVIGKQFTLIIQDDCLLGGSYAGSSKIGNQTYTNTASITSTDCKNYLLSNWNIGIPFLSFDAIKPTLTFIDNGDNSLTVPTQNNAELGSTDKIKGTGAWNPKNRVITLNLQFTIKLTTGKDTLLSYSQTYTPQ